MDPLYQPIYHLVIEEKALSVGSTKEIVESINNLKGVLDHVWIGAVSAVAAVIGLGSGAVAWFWRERREFYQERICAISQQAQQWEERAHEQEEKANAALQAATEAASKSPEAVKATIEASLEFLKHQNTILNEELMRAKLNLEARGADLAKVTLERATQIEQRRALEYEVQEARAYIRSLESELESRREKTVQAELFVTLVQQGFLNREIVASWTKESIKRADSAGQRVRAQYSIQKQKADVFAKERNAIKKHNKRVAELEKQESLQARNVLRAPLPEESNDESA